MFLIPKVIAIPEDLLNKIKRQNRKLKSPDNFGAFIFILNENDYSFLRFGFIFGYNGLGILLFGGRTKY